eukprot:10750464-Ditylum_brightwellii.AAC.1
MSNMFNITDEESTIEEYLGIIKVIPGMDRANEHKTPAASTTVLTKDIDGKERKEDWNYKAMVGMLNFIVGSTMSEIAYATHQCA